MSKDRHSSESSSASQRRSRPNATAAAVEKNAISPTVSSIRAGQAALTLGMRGEAVAHIQRLLKLGAEERYTGTTIEAVKAFQTRERLPVNGVVNQLTLKKLERHAATTRAALARAPATQARPAVPARSPSTAPAKFSVSIDLPEAGIGDQFIPLPEGKDWRDSKVGIELEIESSDSSFQADHAEVQVIHNTVIILRQSVGFKTPGTYIWEWDGYDANGVLDTRRLIEKGVSIKFVVRKGSVTHEALLEPDNEYEEVDWVDVVVDLRARQVEVFVYVDLQNESSLPTVKFNHLAGLVQQGISKYWSRQITVGKDTFQVKTTVVQREDDSEDLDLYVETGSDYARSHNSGIIDGSIFYNEGYFSNAADADADFKLTAAHEFGHAILTASGGKKLSWGHKGSTNPILQSAYPTTPTYPTAGEIDLMKYYNGSEPPDVYVRTIAAEEDVKRLIGLVEVDFDE